MSTAPETPQEEVYETHKSAAYVLRCTKEIAACPELAVGDRLWQVAREIWPGGYEYMVTRRISDGAVIKFRVDHLDDCFELEEHEMDFGYKEDGVVE